MAREDGSQQDSTFYLHRDGYRYIVLGFLLLGTFAPLVDLALWLLGHAHKQPDLGHFIVPPVCALLGVWCILSMLNTRIALTETDLVIQDWKKAKRHIALDSITAVIWRQPNASCYPELSVELTDATGEVRPIILTRWAMAVFAAKAGDAIVLCLGFNPSGGTAEGKEGTVYRSKAPDRETALEEAGAGRQEWASMVYWPYRNWVQYIFLIGWPLLAVVGLSTFLTVFALAIVPADSLADYLYPQLVFLPFWGMVVWQALEAMNTAIICTDTHLIRQNWLRKRTCIRWDSIVGVIWRPQKVGFGWGIHKVLEVEISGALGDVGRVKIAGGVAGEGCARRIRDAIIAIRGFSNIPRDRRPVGHYGEEVIWR